jgi:hypothetical protein
MDEFEKVQKVGWIIYQALQKLDDDYDKKWAIKLAYEVDVSNVSKCHFQKGQIKAFKGEKKQNEATTDIVTRFNGREKCDVCGGLENVHSGEAVGTFLETLKQLFGEVRAENGYSIMLCKNCVMKIFERIQQNEEAK